MLKPKVKKQGYERASKEYGRVYRTLETEIQDTKSLIEKQKNSYGSQADALIEKLRYLENKKADLERQVNSKASEVSRKYDIPLNDVKRSLASGTLIVGGSTSVDVLDLVYRHKERKLREAEQRGYAEVRELYENKINKLKAELKRLKENGERDTQELLSMIGDIFADIANEQMKIAELEILL